MFDIVQEIIGYTGTDIPAYYNVACCNALIIIFACVLIDLIYRMFKNVLR